MHLIVSLKNTTTGIAAYGKPNEKRAPIGRITGHCAHPASVWGFPHGLVTRNAVGTSDPDWGVLGSKLNRLCALRGRLPMGTPVPVAFANVIREQTKANMGKFSLGLSHCLYSVEKVPV